MPRTPQRGNTLRIADLVGRACCPKDSQPLIILHEPQPAASTHLLQFGNKAEHTWLRPHSRAATYALLAWREELAVLHCSHHPIINALRPRCNLAAKVISL